MAVQTKEARKAKDPERTRKDILQAALEEFACSGFSAATVRDIAARIGMSHGMIRYHYETKEQLWFAAVAYLFDRLERELSLSAEDRKKLNDGDIDIFRDWLRRYVHYCARYPEHARIMIQESVAPSERLKLAIERHVVESHKEAIAVINSLKDKGVFPTHAPAASIIYMISGACQNLFALAPEAKYAMNYDAQTRAAIDAHAEAVVDIFCPKDK